MNGGTPFLKSSTTTSSGTMRIITHWATRDVRFPTSKELDGSDAMNPDPDYSAACVSFGAEDGPRGHSSVFTIGRGNDVQVAALEALRPYVLGRDLDELLADMSALYLELTGDSQLRWLGPEKGVMHMAIGAVVNALWDVKAKEAHKPLWELLSDMNPEELAGLIDYRYISTALDRDRVTDMFRSQHASRAERKDRLRNEGYPAYTTSPGWLGYSDDKLVRLAREAMEEGFTRIKLKVGANKDDDVRRLTLARETCGEGFPIAVDANQRWEVDEAIDWISALSPMGLDWVEEPTSPDDVNGHAAIQKAVAPTRVSTGEHMANRVIAHQLLESGAVSVLQIDSARVAGVNENLAILALAHHFGVPVFPHAGGVGLCEAVQHLAFFDYVALSGTKEDRAIEYVDHLHEHFVDPVDVRAGRYWPTDEPGSSQEMVPESMNYFAFPDGGEWASA
jgi:L-fuconate dehydratase